MIDIVSDMKIGFFNEVFPGNITIKADEVIPFENAGNIAGLGPKVAESVNPYARGFGSIAVNPLVSAVVLKGSTSVYINGRECGRTGDPVNNKDMVVAGSGSVFIEGKPATRRKNVTSKKRNIVTDANNVYIGD